MLVNASAFIPQTVRICRLKTSTGVSPFTYIIFLVIQGYLVFHSYFYDQDIPLAIGYFISMFACGSVLVATLLFHDKKQIPKLPIEIYQAISQFPGHLYIKDATGQGLWCNANNAIDFGLSSEDDFVGKRDADLFNISEARSIHEADKEVIKSGKLMTVEELVTVNGEERLYQSLKIPLRDKHNNIVGLIGNSIDITDAKKVVTEKLAMLENIIAMMPGYVYWMDREGTYLGCNDNEAKVIGLSSRKEIVGKKNVDMPGFLIAEELDPVNEKIMSTGKAITLEEPAKLPNGKDGIFISSKTPLKDHQGNVIGLLGVSIDITERKKMENELVLSKEKAEVASKAKEEFLYNMRHDIRTPFSGISGMAHLLQDQETDPQKLKYIHNISASSEQLLDYLNTILEFTQTESGSVPIVSKQVFLKELVEACVDMFRSATENSQIQLIFDYDDNLSNEYFTDDFRVKRILINLIGNAVKFTPKGGKIEVLASLAGHKPGTREALVRLAVKDTGIGIPEEKQDIIFEKFERLTSSYKGKYKGTGLGLYAVKTLVHDLEGDVKVESRVGQGATFICDIPMIEPRSSEYVKTGSVKKNSAMAKPSQSWSNDTTHHILLVEDGEMMQMAARSLLENLSCFVDVAETGEQAIQLCENNQYDLILMDIGLPGIDGFEATKKIRALENNQTIPIIALTAHAADEIGDQCEAVGLNQVCSKPITQEKIKSLFLQFFEEDSLHKSTQVLSEGRKNYEHINAAVIDLETTIQRRGSEQEALDYLILLKKNIGKSMQCMEEQMLNKNWDALRKEAHKLKGTLSVVCVPTLTSVVEQFNQDTLKSGNDDSLQRWYEQLKAASDQFQQTLVQLIK